MRRLALALLLGLAPLSALAEGFAARDLTTVASEAKAALGGRYAARAEAARLTLVCTECEGSPMIDVLLGRQADGTEERVRSGQTPIARLEARCRQRNPDCRVTGLSVAPAVGWISRYRMGAMSGATAIVLRDGDLLTIRSLAGDEATASHNARTLVEALSPRIVGP
ncbi:hypothetical protein [Methylobacterium sp. B4]|uniref:hypothetical protein n=1 Tax=Methylobacterium sp. B4 TaxID=1938755 RepID=UPI000D7637DF|nr:hypothetical protein [Methylobacterium sp. B4]PXW65408.1 hypothetical protein BY998_103218 [Methylobacterium sp. B4]